MQANTGQNQSGHNQGGQQAKPSLSWSQPAAQPSTTIVPPPAVVSAPAHKAADVSSKQSSTSTYVGILIAGIIVGLLIGWVVVGSRGGGSVATPTASSTSEMGTSAASSTSLQIHTTPGTFAVVSPQAAGFAVSVSNVVVVTPTWVVIYEDHAGTPGNALGAALFLPQSQGTAQSGTVELLRATLPGQLYLAGESLDDGDRIFSLNADKPVHDVQGNLIMTQFTTK